MTGSKTELRHQATKKEVNLKHAQFNRNPDIFGLPYHNFQETALFPTAGQLESGYKIVAEG